MVACVTLPLAALRAEGLVKPDSWFFKSVDPYLERSFPSFPFCLESLFTIATYEVV
jgi:hypothetical protein